MTDNNALARPYAQAAFEYAKAQHALDRWQHALAALAQCVRDEKIKTALQLPQSTPERTAGIILGLLDGCLDADVINFVRLLATYNRLMVLPAVAALFDALCYDRKKTLHIDVTTVFELADSEKGPLEAALTAHFKKTVTVSYHIDTAMLGGVMIKAGDKVIDASFVGQLKQLTTALVA